MTRDNNSFAAFGLRRRAERQEVITTGAFTRSMHGETLPGWCSLVTEQTDVDGSQKLTIDASPNITGLVYLIVEAEKRSGDKRPSTRSLHLLAKPDAIRQFALLLLETVEEAEAKAPRPTLVE